MAYNLRAASRECPLGGRMPEWRRPRTRSRLVREETDPALLGSEADFDGFYLNEYHAVVSLALALSGNRWAAEDIAQEAFLVVHRNWARVSGYDQPALWVRRVAANLAVSLFRRSVAEAKA